MIAEVTTMALLRTAWTVPGGGETVDVLLQWTGIVADPKFPYDESARTELAIMLSGPPEPYDRERAREALSRVGVMTL